MRWSIYLLVVTACAAEESPRMPGAELALRNPGSACDEDPFKWFYFPDPQDVGHYATTRLTPPGAISLEQVSYQLRQEPGIECDASLSHRVVVFLGDAVTPPATPTVLYGQAIRLAPEETRIRTVDARIEPPIVVEAGQHIFVGIELVGDFSGDEPHKSCVKYCEQGGTADDRDYLSGESVAPFTWQPAFVPNGRHHTFDVRAAGHSLE